MLDYYQAMVSGIKCGTLKAHCRVARSKRSVGVGSLAFVSSDSHALRTSERATRTALR